MRKFWQSIDRFGQVGTTRLTWSTTLGDDFAAWGKLLRPRDTVDSIEDPDFPGHVLDLEEQPDGSFLAFSREIPSHRAPLPVPRAQCVRLVPDVRAIAAFLAPKLGFQAACRSRRGRHDAVHEIGRLDSERSQSRAVNLFIPDSRPREAALKAAVCEVPDSILLLPTGTGYEADVVALAERMGVEIRVLTTARELQDLSIAPARRTKRRASKRTPLFTPKPGQEWKHLSITIEKEGLRFQLAGTSRFQTWDELRIRPTSSGEPHRFVTMLAEQATGVRYTQRRNDTGTRKRITDLTCFLRGIVELPGKPFRKFEDGWGLLCPVDDKLARRQVANWEAEDDEDDDADSIDLLPDGLDHDELTGFSVHRL